MAFSVNIVLLQYIQAALCVLNLYGEIRLIRLDTRSPAMYTKTLLEVPTDWTNLIAPFSMFLDGDHSGRWVKGHSVWQWHTEGPQL